MIRLRALVSELHRRRVFKTLAAYTAVAWVVVEVLKALTPTLDLPSATVHWVIVLEALALPLVVALAWIYDVTPRGIERTAAVSPASRVDPGPEVVPPAVSVTSAALLTLAVGTLGAWIVWPRPALTDPPDPPPERVERDSLDVPGQAAGR